MNTVRSTHTTKVVTLHNTSCTATLRRPNNINKSPLTNQTSGQLLPNLKPVRTVVTTKLANKNSRLTARLGQQLNTSGRSLFLATARNAHQMTTLSTRREPSRLLPEPNLNSLIAIAIDSPNLHHNARPSLNHCHRNNDSIVIVNLRHSDFFTKQTDRHNTAPVRRNRKRNTSHTSDGTIKQTKKPNTQLRS
jgi:hypothetical protein